MSAVADTESRTTGGGPGTASTPHARPAPEPSQDVIDALTPPPVDLWEWLVLAHQWRDSMRGRRVMAVKAVAAGWPVKAVAMAVEVAPTTVHRWINAAAEKEVNSDA